jgi:3-oxoacyl-[acyl-carrier protein] reductase
MEQKEGRNMVDLRNRLAVVSGGARDIGRAVCLQLAKCGASVAFSYRESARQAEDTVVTLRQMGATALAVSSDATKWADVDAFFDRVQNSLQRPIDILVNNVGGLCARKKIDEIDESFWDLVIDLNLKSTFMMTKAALPRMSDGGAIVNVSSQAGRDGGGPGALAYATAKGGVMTFTRGLAKELGPRRIRVNAICPGMTNTTFHDTFTKPEVRQRVAAMTPLGREGEAAEVGALVAYLASSDASFINGACIDINGGILFS